MALDKFVQLLKIHADCTNNIRIYSGNWKFTGADAVPDHVIKEIPQIITFLGSKILKNSRQCALIYNFQLALGTEHHLYELGVLVKPLHELNHTNELNGEVLDLIIDADTGKIVNSTNILLKLNLTTPEEVKETSTKLPMTYGNYRKCLSPVCFIPLDVKDTSESEKIRKIINKENVSVFDDIDVLTKNLDKQNIFNYCVVRLACDAADFPFVDKSKVPISLFFVNALMSDGLSSFSSPQVTSMSHYPQQQ